VLDGHVHDVVCGQRGARDVVWVALGQHAFRVRVRVRVGVGVRVRVRVRIRIRVRVRVRVGQHALAHLRGDGVDAQLLGELEHLRPSHGASK